MQHAVIARLEQANKQFVCIYFVGNQKHDFANFEQNYLHFCTLQSLIRNCIALAHKIT